MNWGYKIALGLGAFIIFIIGAGIYMVSHDSDTLVESDYYEKGLNYDETFHKKENLLNDHAKPTIHVLHDTLLIQFSSKVNKGSLNFKRLDDKNQDKQLPFYTDTDQFKFPTSSFKKGNWNLEIDWVNSDKLYISDHSVFIE